MQHSQKRFFVCILNFRSANFSSICIQHMRVNLTNLIDKDLISSVNQIQLKTDNQFMNMKVLPSLNEDTVSLVYQLMIFSKSEHCFIHIIISQCCDFLQFITEHYINSSLSQH